MDIMKRIISGALLVALVLIMSISGVAAQGDSTVRFVHVVPNTAPVDVYVNGTLAVTNLTYGSASTYVHVPAGNHTLTVTPAGVANALWEQSFTAEAGGAATFVASSAGQFARFNDNLTPTSLGGTRLLLVHALAGGPSVDVQLAQPVELNGVTQAAGTVIAQSMAYGASFGAFDLPAQTYVVNVLPTGGTGFDTILANVPLNLSSGTSYMAVVYGTTDNPQAMLVASAIPAENAGNIRFVHSMAGGPAVDIYANDTLIAPGVTEDTPTEHIALPAGDYALSLRVAGSDEEVATGNVTLQAGATLSIIAINDGSGVTLSLVSDDVALVNSAQATLKFFNSIADSTVSFALSNGTALASDLEAGSASSAIALPPTRSSLSFTITLSDATGTLESETFTFYGGVYYNVILQDGSAFAAPSLLVVSTAIAQDLTSAPGAGEVSVAVGGGDTSSNPDVQTTPDPVAQATPPPVQQPVQTQNEDGVTARVQLDPSANLQLRQYPDRNSLSLGLAPSGSLLNVIGREGRPVALVEGQDPPPEAETYVDPATLLEDEDDDLDPQETWLRIDYTTPDGGHIIAWVLAQYLVVTDDEGDLQRLADLPAIGLNIPGEAENTEITPPPIPEDVITATVFNLNPGVSLNIRRTPTTSGEVLERMPNDTVTELVGFLENDEFDPEASEWAFIRYLPAGGGSITGWVSTQYIEYEWNNRRIDATELFERELMGFVTADTIGRVTGGAEVAPLPTPDPLEDAYVAEVRLNPGANLQFRLAPDRDSESLNLIPTGTRLIINGRNAEGDWVQTSYEGQTGWVASQFVVISFNGAFVEIEEVPIIAIVDEEDEG